MSRPLNPKQLRFIDEYLVDLNGTAAAIRAGYSPRTARVQASDLLLKPDVQRALAAKQEARAVRVDAKADDVLRELMRLAFTDIGAIFDEQGGLLPVRQMPVDARRAIASVETRVEQHGDDPPTVITKVKMWDKVKSLELLGKHLRLFADKVELTGTQGLTVVVRKYADDDTEEIS